MNELQKIETRATQAIEPVIPLDVSLEEMAQITNEFQQVPITHNRYAQLRKLGVGMEQAGVVRLTNGYSLLSMDAMSDAIRVLHQKIVEKGVEPERFEALCKMLGYLTERLAKITKNAVETEETARVGAEEAEKRRRRSFLPHTVVQINMQKNG